MHRGLYLGGGRVVRHLGLLQRRGGTLLDLRRDLVVRLHGDGRGGHLRAGISTIALLTDKN